MIPLKLVDYVAKLICKIVKLRLHFCEFILLKEYIMDMIIDHVVDDVCLLEVATSNKELSHAWHGIWWQVNGNNTYHHTPIHACCTKYHRIYSIKM